MSNCLEHSRWLREFLIEKLQHRIQTFCSFRVSFKMDLTGPHAHHQQYHQQLQQQLHHQQRQMDLIFEEVPQHLKSSMVPKREKHLVVDVISTGEENSIEKVRPLS